MTRVTSICFLTIAAAFVVLAAAEAAQATEADSGGNLRNLAADADASLNDAAGTLQAIDLEEAWSGEVASDDADLASKSVSQHAGSRIGGVTREPTVT